MHDGDKPHPPSIIHKNGLDNKHMVTHLVLKWTEEDL